MQSANGGARRVRTDDLMLAKHALYQLSYGPKLKDLISRSTQSVVGPGGLEPPTSRLSGVCSNQLSYRPKALRHNCIIWPKRPTTSGKRNEDGGAPPIYLQIRQ